MPVLADVELRRSRIHGTGMFACRTISKGQIVFIWSITANHKVVTEEEVISIERINPVVRDNSCRIAGRYFVISEHGLDDSELVNHSSTPNILYHVGIGIAVRRIDAGEELTIDYRLVNPTNTDADGDHDRGFSARQSMLRSAQFLTEIVKCDLQWQG